MAEQGPTAPTPPTATDVPVTDVPQRQHLWLVRGLIVLASLLLVISALAIWTARTALDTPTWTDTSGQMLENPTIRSALSTYLVDQLYTNVNVANELQKYLPSQVKGLAAPAAAGLREYAYQGANRVLATPAVQSAVAQREPGRAAGAHPGARRPYEPPHRHERGCGSRPEPIGSAGGRTRGRLREPQPQRGPHRPSSTPTS